MTLTNTSPIDKFAMWFNRAKIHVKKDPNAMIVSTCGWSCPDSRVVLMKSFDERGFVFYTNYESAKGRDLDANPMCSLLFYWSEIGRQVRIQGNVKRLSSAESNRYFRSRPILSQYGAMASPQSREISSRLWLIQQVLSMFCFPSRPDHWGGYIVEPFRMEFWEEGKWRLHHREQYTLQDGKWWKRILAP